MTRSGRHDYEMREPPPKADVYIGRTTFRSAGILFGIQREDRFSHMYIIGKTGTGKSTFLRNLIVQDLAKGTGLAVFDPHGDLVESVLPFVPAWRRSNLVYLNVPDRRLKWTFNPFAGVPSENRALAAASMVEVFKKLWPDDWGPRLEHLLRNVVWTLLETPGASFADVPRLLVDRDFRRAAVFRVKNSEVRAFWRDEFERYSPAFRAVVVAPLQNKIGGFLTDPVLKAILAAERSSFDIEHIMDSNKVLLVNLSRGRIGEGPAALLGSLLVSSLGLSAFKRANRPTERRRDFFIYIDEFHTFATLSLATMLSELRKYRVGLVLAHQYLSQLETEVRDAVFGNAGTFMAFRVGAQDALLVKRELGEPIQPEDLNRIPNFNMYLRLLIGGEPSPPLSAISLPP